MDNDLRTLAIERLSDARLALLVDPALGEKAGEQGLRAIHMLHAVGFDTFSYFSQWRTRDLKGRAVPREPGGYSYVSLAGSGSLDRIRDDTALACFTTQSAEDDHFSLGEVVRSHLDNAKPSRLCLVVDRDDFTLRSGVGRPLADEEFVRGYRVFLYSNLLNEMKDRLNLALGRHFRYCPSWATLGWAVSLLLVDQVHATSIGELLQRLPQAPYLKFWEDMTYLTSYGETRPDDERSPIERPELCLSRHYGLPLKLARTLWLQVERGADRLLHPYSRTRWLEEEYADSLASLVKQEESVDSLAARIIHDSVIQLPLLQGGATN